MENAVGKLWSQENIYLLKLAAHPLSTEKPLTRLRFAGWTCRTLKGKVFLALRLSVRVVRSVRVFDTNSNWFGCRLHDFLRIFEHPLKHTHYKTPNVPARSCWLILCTCDVLSIWWLLKIHPDTRFPTIRTKRSRCVSMCGRFPNVCSGACVCECVLLDTCGTEIHAHALACDVYNDWPAAV